MANIKYEPRLPLILFGDGYQARYLTQKEEIREDGVKVTKIFMIPTVELMEVAGIKAEELEETDSGYKATWQEYPSNYVNWLNSTARDGVILIDCTFRGGQTRHMAKYKGLLELDQQRDEVEASLRMRIATIMDENRILMSQFDEYLRRMSIHTRIAAGGVIEEGGAPGEEDSEDT